MSQPNMFGIQTTPAPANPVKAERQRLTANALKVLARLKEGPATNVELVQIGGIRAVGRVWDLERDGWHITKRHLSGGLWVYELHGMKNQPVPTRANPCQPIPMLADCTCSALGPAAPCGWCDGPDRDVVTR